MSMVLSDPTTFLDADDAWDVPKQRKGGIGIAAWVAVAWMIFVFVLAIGASRLQGIGAPFHSIAESARQGPFSVSGHPLGGDVLGRDMLARVAYGAQHSLAISFGAVFMGFVFGGILGLVAGYVGGKTDSFLTAMMDILLAFPALVLALTLVIFLKNQEVGPF